MPWFEELKVQEPATVLLADTAMGVDVQLTVRPVEGLATALRVTLPAKLKVLVRETDMEAPVAPELKLTGLLAEIVKAPT